MKGRSNGGPKGRPLIIIVIFSGLLNLNFSGNQRAWEKVSYGISEPEITCMVFDVKGGPSGRPLEQSPAQSTVLIGTTKSVYQSRYKGRDSEMILQVSGAARRVNYLYVSPVRAATIYAATDSGLFLSANDGETWKRIFFSNDSRERRCLRVLESEKMTYLATAGGLFYKEINGPIWQRAQGDLNKRAVSFLASDGIYIYAATENKVLRIDSQSQGFVEIFSVVGHEINGSAAEPSEAGEGDTMAYKKQITFLTATHKRKPELYAATSKGIFYSPDQGESWERIDSNGLPLEDLTSLAVLKEGEVILGTQKGVFLETEDGWEHIYNGMETSKINFLVCDRENNLYAATDNGIFLMLTQKISAEGKSAIARSPDSLAVHEPSIRDVQRMAVLYADVDPEKIKGWRRAAAKKAWLPNFSVGLDADKNKTLSDNVYGTYSGGGQSYIGPRDKTFYNNFGWSASLSWDLGDLIWNNDQTSIDSRSKLMVELREDILDQVTRLYFERRRLQTELSGNLSLETQDRSDKEMRVQELTALIDGFTGGEFSRRIETCRQSPVASDQ